MSAFQSPWLLLLAALVPLAWWLRRRRGDAAVRFGPAPFTDGLPHSLRERLVAMPRGLHVLGLLLVVVALARPASKEQLPRTSEGIDILLAVDVSSSMTANDLDPPRSRLELAKAAATRFVDARPDDRIGLVRFARYPDVACPLTLDHDALSRFLAGLDPVARDSDEDRTGIGTAVARAAEVLRSSAARSKVVVLLTDGEENVASADTPDEIGPLDAARMCEALGVRVYTIAAGIGKRGPHGEWLPLDTKQVERLAELTHGRSSPRATPVRSTTSTPGSTRSRRCRSKSRASPGGIASCRSCARRSRCSSSGDCSRRRPGGRAMSGGASFLHRTCCRSSPRRSRLGRPAPAAPGARTSPRARGRTAGRARRRRARCPDAGTPARLVRRGAAARTARGRGADLGHGRARGRAPWRDIVVCLDVSRSMLAADIAPTRLARARHEVRALAGRARGDRLALVAFAGDARLLVPLTRDARTYADLVGDADPFSVAAAAPTSAPRSSVRWARWPSRERRRHDPAAHRRGRPRATRPARRADLRRARRRRPLHRLRLAARQQDPDPHRGR